MKNTRSHRAPRAASFGAVRTCCKGDGCRRSYKYNSSTRQLIGLADQPFVSSASEELVHRKSWGAQWYDYRCPQPFDIVALAYEVGWTPAVAQLSGYEM
jgi:hypothetical protein